MKGAGFIWWTLSFSAGALLIPELYFSLHPQIINWYHNALHLICSYDLHYKKSCYAYIELRAENEM